MQLMIKVLQIYRDYVKISKMRKKNEKWQNITCRGLFWVPQVAFWGHFSHLGDTGNGTSVMKLELSLRIVRIIISHEIFPVFLSHPIAGTCVFHLHPLRSHIVGFRMSVNRIHINSSRLPVFFTSLFASQDQKND